MTSEPPDSAAPAVRSAALSFASFALPIAMLGVMWPEVRVRFDQSLGSLGVVSLLYGVARLSMATRGRPLMVRFGSARAFVGVLACLVATTAAVAASPFWAWVLVAIVALGLASGLLDSMGAAFVTTLGNVGSAGLIHGSYGIGATTAPLVVAAAPSWRVAVLIASAVAVLALVVAHRARAAWPAVHHEVAAAAGGTEHESSDRLRIAATLGLFGTFVATEVTVGQWSHTYLTDFRGLESTPAALGVAGFWAGITLGRLALARSEVRRLVERIGVRGLTGTAAASTVGMIVLPAALAAGALLLIGLALSTIIPTLFATTSARFGRLAAGRLAGWQLLATNVGAISVPSLTGVLVDRIGPQAIAVVMVAILGGIGGPLLVVVHRGPSGWSARP